MVIYDSTAPEGSGEGVYIQAEAHELGEQEEILVARRITQSRKNQAVGDDEAIKFNGDAIRRVYIAVPQKVWMNDDEKDENGNYIRDIRVETSIEETKKYLTS